MFNIFVSSIVKSNVVRHAVVALISFLVCELAVAEDSGFLNRFDSLQEYVQDGFDPVLESSISLESGTNSHLLVKIKKDYSETPREFGDPLKIAALDTIFRVFIHTPCKQVQITVSWDSPQELKDGSRFVTLEVSRREVLSVLRDAYGIDGLDEFIGGQIKYPDFIITNKNIYSKTAAKHIYNHLGFPGSDRVFQSLKAVSQ